MRSQCSIPGCDKPVIGRGWCRTHYHRWHRHGDPLRVKQPAEYHARRDLGERFWEKVDQSAGPGGCWPWTAHIMRLGYGRFKADGKYLGAHRVAYELAVGPIPEGLEIDHLCRVRHCVNPAHLEVVTRLENMRRRVMPVLTHCKRGHPFDEENTYVMPSGNRACRTCRRDTDREAKRRARAAARAA